MSGERDPMSSLPPMTPEEQLLIDRATGDAMDSAPDGAKGFTREERAAAAAHIAMTRVQRMPASVMARLVASAENVTAAGAAGAGARAGAGVKPDATAASGRGAPTKSATPAAASSRVDGPSSLPMKTTGGSSKTGWLAAAAGFALFAGAAVYGWLAIESRSRELAEAKAELSQLRSKISDNEKLLETAQLSVKTLEVQLADSKLTVESDQAKLVDAASKQVELAEKLAKATADLDQATLKIAKLETPVDPTVLDQSRRKLLDVPDTIQIAWKPFDLPDKPAELHDVQGDVVWNDSLQLGYLRFQGLKVNDPKVEQYQVWVIDERGMEQKVSGGVFNATAAGEIIVPIEPGIDVGRVGLFAITIEKPGGTWVPDLTRRVVVAPR